MELVYNMPSGRIGIEWKTSALDVCCWC